ncbi:UPF0164 family protein [Candidatus Fermentibacterales bacterium]|nr:UPF0164 family protein [Candidatus Fermentibacterales bacterium]
MRFRNRAFALAAAMLAALLLDSASWAAKYAGEFLYVGAGGRALGMGSAFVAVADDASAAYWNPAGVCTRTGQSAQFMHSERFGGLIRYDYLSYSRVSGTTGLGASLFRTDAGRIADTTDLEWYDTGSDGVFGVDGEGVPGDAGDDDYDPSTNPGGTEGNGVWDPGEELIYDEGRISYGGSVDWALYLTWSRQLTSDLSVGGSAKLIQRGLMDHSAYGVGLDLGVLWRPVPALSCGLNLQDAFGTYLFWDTGSNEAVLPTAKAGLALHWPLRKFASDITLSLDGDFRFEGREFSAQYHLGRMSLDTHMGLEITVRNLVSLRVGSNEGSMTAGAGLALPLFGKRVSLDYAFLSHQDLDSTHRVSLGVDF